MATRLGLGDGSTFAVKEEPEEMAQRLDPASDRPDTALFVTVFPRGSNIPRRIRKTWIVWFDKDPLS